MERILILTATEKSSETLRSFIASFFPSHQIEICFYGAECRRLLQQKTFDFILINTPLSDEFGTDIAIFSAKQTTAGVLLLIKNDIINNLCENKTEEQAHKYIERQAMNQRRQKKEIAKEIIDYYDKQNEI